MAAAVAGVIEKGGTLVAEAGTGTGKTLAYLIPAILSGQRVLISTGTKNLQEQIFFKDLPSVQQALGKPFTATLMKGRSNYLCLQRLETFGSFETLESFGSFGSFGSFHRPDDSSEPHSIKPLISTTPSNDLLPLRAPRTRAMETAWPVLEVQRRRSAARAVAAGTACGRR